MNLRTKKLSVLLSSVVLFACALVFAAPVSDGSGAYCEAATGDTDFFGYELGDYYAKITYDNYTLYGSGVYIAYEITFDDDFYCVLANKATVMSKIKKTFVDNGFKVSVDEVNGKMTASIEFDSLTDYYAANGENGYETSDSAKPTKSTFFYNDYTVSYQTVFVNLKTEGKYVNRLYNACVDLGITDDKIVLDYVYGTPYSSRLITSSADSVTYSASSKLYYHSFIMGVDERGESVTINQHSPNPTGWYVIAVAFGLVVLAAPLTVAILRKKKERKSNGQ